MILYLDHVGVDTALREHLALLFELLQLGVRSHPHAVPRPLVGEDGRLDARLEAEDREPRLLVVGVRGVLERARLDEINVLRGFLLTGGAALLAQALADLLLAHRLLGARAGAVEVELRSLRLRRGDRRRTHG